MSKNNYTRPTRPKHDGTSKPKKDFEAAFDAVRSSAAPGKTYKTASDTPFTARAYICRNGEHKGEKVIVFYSIKGTESARSYSCCWKHEVNCNRTYIDIYVPEI